MVLGDESGRTAVAKKKEEKAGQKGPSRTRWKGKPGRGCLERGNTTAGWKENAGSWEGGGSQPPKEDEEQR